MDSAVVVQTKIAMLGQLALPLQIHALTSKALPAMCVRRQNARRGKAAEPPPAEPEDRKRPGTTASEGIGGMMRLGAMAALLMLACPASAMGEVLRQGEFLQDYVTCEAWLKREAADAEIHGLIGRWAIDSLRRSSPSRLSKYGDGEVLDAVERQCRAQPGKTLTVATFLAGLRLPE